MKTNPHPSYDKIHAQFAGRVGEYFEEFKGIFLAEPLPCGEILEVKPTGICVDDGHGDEVFVSFLAIHRARFAVRKDLQEILNAI